MRESERKALREKEIEVKQKKLPLLDETTHNPMKVKKERAARVEDEVKDDTVLSKK